MGDIVKAFLYIVTLRWLFNGGCKTLITILILLICTIMYFTGSFD
jgi:hypothetical protein